MPRFVCWLLFSLTFVSVADAQQWARFRGPNGQGQSDAKTVPNKWTAEDYNWRVKLPGTGHSSPVLWGEKIFLLSADPKNATRYVLCLSAKDGSILWQRDFKSAAHHLHARNSFASCSPAGSGCFSGTTRAS
jgi:outer membrane protein assembly factor BamB